jgi:hypothetical protein
MLSHRLRNAVVLGVLSFAGAALSGCSTSIADNPLLATPADAPEQPKDPGGYIPVNALPPDRDEAVMDPATRAKIQKDLIAARDRQATTTAAQNGQAAPSK